MPEEESSTRGRQGLFWGKLGGLLAIFGAAFSVATYVISITGVVERVTLSGFIASLSALIFRGIEAGISMKQQLDKAFVSLTAIALVFAIWHIALLGDNQGSEARVPSGGNTPIIQGTATTSEQPSTSKAPTPSTTSQDSNELPEFDPSSEPVFRNGSITVRIGRIPYRIDVSKWEAYYGIGAPDISFSEAGMAAGGGVQLALITPGAARNFTTCRSQHSWVTSVNWSRIQRGTFMCLHTKEGRRGILRIDKMPNFNADEPRIQLTGIIWRTLV